MRDVREFFLVFSMEHKQIERNGGESILFGMSGRSEMIGIMLCDMRCDTRIRRDSNWNYFLELRNCLVRSAGNIL